MGSTRGPPAARRRGRGPGTDGQLPRDGWHAPLPAGAGTGEHQAASVCVYVAQNSIWGSAERARSGGGGGGGDGG